MVNNGVFDMRTPQDLLRKASYDLERLRNNPSDSYAAFDFFVSARHLPDWLHPNDDKCRKALFSAHVELRICRHIIDTGKHYIVTHSMHRQVRETERTFSLWAKSVWKPGTWGSHVWSENDLFIHLDSSDSETIKFGSRIRVLEFANKVMEILEQIAR